MQVFTTSIVLATLVAAAFQLTADEVYRSVDAEGNVIYTDSPTAGDKSFKKVELPPSPSPSSIQETERRHQEIRRAAERAQRKRLGEEKNQNEEIIQASKALAEAEARLTEVKVIKDEDRQNLAGGKRRVSPEYFERLKAAEADVEAARKHLREVRGY